MPLDSHDMKSGFGDPFVERLISELGSEKVSIDLESRKAATKDYSWLSPILSQNLPAS